MPLCSFPTQTPVCVIPCPQTYYKLSYVDRRIDSPEQRMCEDVPKLAAGLSDLTRELVAATIDAAFYAYQLRWVDGGGVCVLVADIGCLGGNPQPSEAAQQLTSDCLCLLPGLCPAPLQAVQRHAPLHRCSAGLRVWRGLLHGGGQPQLWRAVQEAAGAGGGAPRAAGGRGGAACRSSALLFGSSIW
jgi:hypothetical protein